MSVELWAEDAPDVVDFVCCHLQELLPASDERDVDAPLPSCVVSRISGADDPEAGTDDPVVQLDIYEAKGPTAGQVSIDVHRRMLLLRNSVDVTMSDQSIANNDTFETLLKPFRMAFEHDQIVRYVARYQLGLSFVTVV